MATTSLSLGEHWEVFIKNEIASGRYGSASEVVRDAVRHMQAVEEGGKHRAALNAFEGEDDAAMTGIREGVAQLEAGEYLELDGDETLKDYFSDVVSRGKTRGAGQKGKVKTK